MKKLIAIVNVIAWSGFWAFGYLALTADGLTGGQMVVAALLAFGGLVTGLLAYMKLARAAEDSGTPDAGVPDGGTNPDDGSSGCSCRIASASDYDTIFVLAVLALGAWYRRRL